MDKGLQSLLFLGVGIYIGMQMGKQQQANATAPFSTTATNAPIARTKRVQYFVPMSSLGARNDTPMFNAYINRALSYNWQ